MRFFAFGLWRALFLAIPFFFLWNFLAPIYLTHLPEAYQQIPFWHCVGFFALIGIVRSLIFFPFLRRGWYGRHGWHGRHGWNTGHCGFSYRRW